VPIPEYFCWSRFGTEAGQAIEHILERKEEERGANSGLFLWGIGNAIGPSVGELLRRTREPEVLFSSIKSPARIADIEPKAVAAWTSAETLEGESYSLPACSLVTSRHDPQTPRSMHYALVCFSAEPLIGSESHGEILFASLHNILTGRQVGASQVTAVVKHEPAPLARTLTYDVAFRAKLVYPYFLRLKGPLLLTNADANLAWSAVVHQFWQKRRSNESQISIPTSLPLAF
jgi:hypothetical protein